MSALLTTLKTSFSYRPGPLADTAHNAVPADADARSGAWLAPEKVAKLTFFSVTGVLVAYIIALIGADLVLAQSNVGSEYQRQDAEWLLAQYKKWGWDVHIERFEVLYPTPKERVLELVSPTRFVAKLAEPPLPVDPYTKETSTQLPGYNIYAADGDVTALTRAERGRRNLATGANPHAAGPDC